MSVQFPVAMAVRQLPDVFARRPPEVSRVKRLIVEELDAARVVVGEGGDTIAPALEVEVLEVQALGGRLKSSTPNRACTRSDGHRVHHGPGILRVGPSLPKQVGAGRHICLHSAIQAPVVGLAARATRR